LGLAGILPGGQKLAKLAKNSKGSMLQIDTLQRTFGRAPEWVNRQANSTLFLFRAFRVFRGQIAVC
jgi:hypothetical protein